MAPPLVPVNRDKSGHTRTPAAPGARCHGQDGMCGSIVFEAAADYRHVRFGLGVAVGPWVRTTHPVPNVASSALAVFRMAG